MATAQEMKWGITGGGGQLAQSLSEILTRKGIDHRSWHHSEIDITEPTSMQLISEFQPNVLVNCAAWTNVDGAEDSFEQALKVNCEGAKNVALTAKELNIPLVHISTDYVFSGEGLDPWHVDDSLHPASKYGISKLLGEQKVQEIWPVKSYIVRTAWLYGPHGKNFAKTIIKKLIANNNPIQVVNDQTGQPTTTLDLANQILSMIYSNIPGGIYHATNSGQATWWEFARELALLNKADISRVVPVTSQQFKARAIRPKNSVLDHSVWGKVGLDSMRDWRVALEDVFPGLRNRVIGEMTSD